jgi:hypothetical protein
MGPYVAVRWVRWFSSVGLPAEHIAAVIDLEPLEVDSALRVRRKYAPVKVAAWFDYKGSTRNRSIRCQTGTYVRRLRELGYEAGRIAELLVLKPRAVADYLERTAPTLSGPRVKPRTKKEQRRVEATARRREQRQAAATQAAADRAAWDHHDARRDDVGCEALAPPPSPGLAELGDRVVPPLEAPPAPPPGPWGGSSNPRVMHGERNGHARLTWPDVREIRRRHADGTSAYALAKEYGVNAGTIRAIVRNETWREADRTQPERTVGPELSPTRATEPAPAPAPSGTWSTDDLTWPKVRKIRRLAAKGVSNVEIARRFHVSETMIRMIVKGLRWRDDSGGRPRPPALPRTGDPPLSQENPCK